MKFNLTIKNNETGEIIQNLDIDAIIGGVHLKGEESAVIVMSETNTLGLFGAFTAAEKAIAHTLEDDEDIKMLAMMKQMFDAKFGEGEEEDEEEDE